MALSENDVKFWQTEIKMLLEHLVGMPISISHQSQHKDTPLAETLTLIKAAFAAERRRVDIAIDDEAKHWVLASKEFKDESGIDPDRVLQGMVAALQELKENLRKRR